MTDLFAQYQELKQKPTRVQFTLSPANWPKFVAEVQKEHELSIPALKEEGKAFYATSAEGNITIYSRTGTVALTGELMYVKSSMIPAEAQAGLF